eukprot:6147909-Prymnesium_polylepis.1
MLCCAAACRSIFSIVKHIPCGRANQRRRSHFPNSRERISVAVAVVAVVPNSALTLRWNRVRSGGCRRKVSPGPSVVPPAAVSSVSKSAQREMDSRLTEAELANLVNQVSARMPDEVRALPAAQRFLWVKRALESIRDEDVHDEDVEADDPGAAEFNAEEAAAEERAND